MSIWFVFFSSGVSDSRRPCHGSEVNWLIEVYDLNEKMINLERINQNQRKIISTFGELHQMIILRENNCKYWKLFEHFRHFLHDFPSMLEVFLLEDDKETFIEIKIINHVGWSKSFYVVISQRSVTQPKTEIYRVLQCVPKKGD